MRGPLLLGIPNVAGLTGAVLTLTSPGSPLAGPLTLLFVLFTPAACVAVLLTGLEAVPRVIVGAAAAIALAAAVAETMLVTATWSPRGGVIAVGAVSALLATVAAVRQHRARSGRRRTTAVSNADGDGDGDDWVFEA
jgi:hypothetical protein